MKMAAGLRIHAHFKTFRPKWFTDLYQTVQKPYSLAPHIHVGLIWGAPPHPLPLPPPPPPADLPATR